jgi:trans-aconitate 3-methyltransferase
VLGCCFILSCFFYRAIMSEQTAPNFFARDEAFWQNYIDSRPKIPQSFFDRIFSYHAQHGGRFEVAHEVGAGPGIHSPRLAEKINHVIVSDPFADNISAAERRLAQHKDRYTFHVNKLEDSMKDVPAQSVDLVFGQAMIHFTNHAKALEACAEQLRPGGTAAFSLVGFPSFADPQVRAVWEDMLQQGVKVVLSTTGGSQDALHTMMLTQITNLDNVAFPEQFFAPGVQRILLNDANGDVIRRTAIAPDLEAEFQFVSQPRSDDVVVRGQFDDDWAFDLDIAGIKRLASTFPFDQSTPHCQARWKDMEAVLGESTTQGFWTCPLLLATRL